MASARARDRVARRGTALRPDRAAKSLVQRLLAPVRALRWRYLPLLMVYLATGASALSGVAETFFVKDKLSLSAEALVAVLVWVQVPWSIKPVFGQLVDGVPIFGSRRRSYVFIGAALVALSYVMLAGVAGEWLTLASPEALYIAASLTTVIGLVLQDTVADAMSTEVVRRSHNGKKRSSAEINAELGMVQVLGRIAFMTGAFAVAGLSGWLVQIFSYEQMFLLALVVPAISVSGSILVKLEVGERRGIDTRILVGGFVFIDPDGRRRRHRIQIRARDDLHPLAGDRADAAVVHHRGDRCADAPQHHLRGVPYLRVPRHALVRAGRAMVADRCAGI